MTTLLQVSDAHFGTEQVPVVQALIRFAHEQSPDVLVLSGDITQRARRRQFNAARKFIEQVNPPAFMAIPGNHDIPLFNVLARIFSPYGNYSRAFGTDLEPEFSAERLLVIGVNTTRPRRHKDGEISVEQIDRVAQRLSRAPAGQVRIVLVHQPVLAIRPGDKANLLHGHRDAVPAWSAAGADIIMGGHIHLPYVRSLRTTFESLPRETWAVQAGTAVSSRIRGRVPNSVNVIRCNGSIGTRECSVERWDFAAGNQSFELHTQQALRFSAEK
jgi:3',5'-cyclic AMP phosphodiesterase CpdA